MSFTEIRLPAVAEVYDVESHTDLYGYVPPGNGGPGTGYPTQSQLNPHDQFLFYGLPEESITLDAYYWGDPWNNGPAAHINAGVGGGAGVIVGPYTAPLNTEIVDVLLCVSWGYAPQVDWKVVDLPSGSMGGDGTSFVAGSNSLARVTWPGPGSYSGGYFTPPYPAPTPGIVDQSPAAGMSILPYISSGSLETFVTALSGGQLAVIVVPQGSEPTYGNREVRWVVLKVILYSGSGWVVGSIGT